LSPTLFDSKPGFSRIFAALAVPAAKETTATEQNKRRSLVDSITLEIFFMARRNYLKGPTVQGKNAKEFAFSASEENALESRSGKGKWK
jgi:hypothetical protein